MTAYISSKAFCEYLRYWKPVFIDINFEVTFFCSLIGRIKLTMKVIGALYGHLNYMTSTCIQFFWDQGSFNFLMTNGKSPTERKTCFHLQFQIQKQILNSLECYWTGQKLFYKANPTCDVVKTIINEIKIKSKMAAWTISFSQNILKLKQDIEKL